MLATRGKQPKGLSLVETMVATVVLSIAVIGASGYRYYAALDTRKADMRMTAARVALLLCESWRGVKGDETYDPRAHFGSELLITVDANDFVPAVPEDFTKLGSYSVSMNGVPCHTTMSWRDVSAGLRALNVVISWPPRATRTDIVDEASVDSNKLFKLTTYTEN